MATRSSTLNPLDQAALNKRRVLIVGLKRSGVAAARFCAERGAKVTVSDSAARSLLQPEVDSLKDLPVDFDLESHTPKQFLEAETIVVSPGVPLSLAPIQAALEKGIEVISEIELASRFLKGSIVAITGSNGKTTTTALMGEVLKAAGFSCLVGGNIGTPLISLVDRSTDETVTVVEASSFQLEAIPTFRPFVGVVLNVTPDHLDRYSSFEEYASFKKALFKNQTREDWAVLNADDPVTAGFSKDLKSRLWWFSTRSKLSEGCCFYDNQVMVMREGRAIPIITRERIPLLGMHNVENCLAVVSMAALLGADFRSVETAISEFTGVEHRLERVAEIRGVRYYNDSKATNVDSTIKALESFDGNVILILGGKDKGSDYTKMSTLLQQKVKEVLLIGAAAEKIERQLSGVLPLQACGTLEKAVNQAWSKAAPGDTVLLAPACASYDQFENYEQRGRRFKELVQSLSKHQQ
ncbi:MAG: UDP-N-acetylmuramoyl-L-alanine--D-glutamate ligase [Acidobacteriia bacterium]|nr:UDP-N-acetylmuramoyl-L-alanine--D-glutamate ligase [Terriglobia bacterium]